MDRTRTPHTEGITMEDIRIERVISSPQYVQAAMLIGEQRALLSEKKPSWKRERQLLESHYRAPNGYLLLAKLGSEPVGVVALQRANDARLEAKRMYVRGKALGRG